ncbi:MAG: DNA N-6-adenine-methyltransferase [Hormoscilla sp.]
MYTGITLFSGLGLADIGLKKAGVNVVGAVEISPAIAEWYQRNNPNCQMMIGSVEEFDYRLFSGVDLLHMSPPCQQYSIARSKKDLPRHKGADAGLLTFKAIEQIRPKFITLENVRGYALAKPYSELKQFLWDLGYWINEEIVNCADYGIPQSRIRLITQWIRNDAVTDHAVIQYQTLFGEKFWGGHPLQKQEHKGWYSAIEDLIPSLPETKLAPWQKKRLPTEFHGDLLVGDQHERPRTTEQPAFTVCIKGPPRAFLIRRNGQKSHSKFVEIICESRPSPTILASQNISGRQFDGWDGQKVVEITPQCLGRFQTLPDSFQLPEKKSLASIGIGNGVPCEMMRQIASRLISPVNSTDMTPPIITKGKPKWTTDDWRTPDEERQPVVTLVKQALGGVIGLDPTADYSKLIPAQRHSTKAEDCLPLDWESPAGTVFLNPPYSNPLPFIKKLIEQMDQGLVKEAIVLLPLRCIGNQGTGKIIKARAKAHCVWNWNGRLAFLAEDGIPRKGPDFISCLIYFGDMEARFIETFHDYGVVSRFDKGNRNMSTNGAVITGTEEIKSPLTQSELNKKGLCDYVINVASGCLHGCTFCYVPSTPVIRFRQGYLQNKGVENPQQDWGKYLFTRDAIAQQLDKALANKRTWLETPAGKGVVMLCSGTDPYQNQRTAAITRACVEVLLKHGKRVRILTRSPLWTQDLDILVSPLVTVGMSLPHLDDRLSRQIEPKAPLPSDRYRALEKGAATGCRLFVAMAPTPPQMGTTEFLEHLSKLKKLNPEVIFWEPINARGTNGSRMLDAGLDFAQDISSTQSWADIFVRQWRELNVAASLADCQELLHIWPDRALKGYIPDNEIESWWSRPTKEAWPSAINQPQSTTTTMFREEDHYDLSENIEAFNRHIPLLEPLTPPIAYLPQAPDTLITSSIDERIAALTEEIESLEEQARIRREEIVHLQEQAKIQLRSEFEEKLKELQELFKRASQYGRTEDFCCELKRFHDQVCPGSCKGTEDTDEAIAPVLPQQDPTVDLNIPEVEISPLPPSDPERKPLSSLDYPEQDSDSYSEREKSIEASFDSNLKKEELQLSHGEDTVLKFQSAAQAEIWKGWFTTLVGQQLGEEVIVTRHKRSRNLYIKNLTVNELKIIDYLELPENLPTPLAAHEMWELAKIESGITEDK